jgi:hypothetical protein
MNRRHTCLFLAAVTMSVVLLSCTRHEVEVKPIHITIDVNVKVDRALDDFFSDIDEAAQEVKP